MNDDIDNSIEMIEKAVDVLNIMRGTRKLYCPKCFKAIEDVNFLTGNPKCSCGWTDEVYDLLTKEESISLNRIELIDNVILKKN